MTLKPLEYVTIDRGSPTRGDSNPFVTPIPSVSDEPEEVSEPKEDPEERPKSLRGSLE